MVKASAVGTAALVAGFLLGAPAQAAKMSTAECQSLWSKLDTAKSGSVTEAQAKSSVTNFKAVDANKDGKLSETEFKSGCDAGHVQSMAITGPSGTPKK